jgi:hypothetical protein
MEIPAMILVDKFPHREIHDDLLADQMRSPGE